MVAVPVATGLDFPAGFTFAPDGRIFYGERFSGEIRILDPRTGSDTLFFTVPAVATAGEQGLLGIALHPRYPSRPFVYAYATRVTGPETRNQILRIRDTRGTGRRARAIWTGERATAIHNGGRILFGPDDRLYAAVGDLADRANGQDLSTTAGKILRMTASGLAPTDNPWPGSVVWSFGHRNSFGFAFDPVTGGMWESDNGPECNDELNRVLPRRNYGWGPGATCAVPPTPPRNTNQDGRRPVLPLAWFTPPIAPTGVGFCTDCGLAEAEGKLLFGAWNTGEIRKVTLTHDRRGIASVTVVLHHPSGIVSVERAPDGALHFSTSSGIWRLASSSRAGMDGDQRPAAASLDWGTGNGPFP